LQQPYKTGTALGYIVEDGWSRDFDTAQTVAEARYMGFTIEAYQVQKAWDICNEQMNNLERIDVLPYLKEIKML
jgi:hypothetical protein